jgi:uncharacterized protein YndB with AHSA1/START domain
MSETRTVPAVVAERRMGHTAAKVWRALTEPGLVGQWLMENDFEPRLGHSFSFRGKPGPGWSGTAHCEVAAIEPGQKLAYHWGAEDSDARSLVTWLLTPRGRGSEVRVVHSGLRGGDRGLRSMGAGWPAILERLDRVAGRIPGD